MQSTKNSQSNFDGSLGIFTVIALVLALWGFCWFKSYSPLHKQQHISVIFPQIAGLNENDGVFVDGVRAGCVDKIAWHSKEQVLVRLRIDQPKIIVPFGSKFNIRSNGIIGAKYVDIKFPPSNNDELLLPIDKNAIVIGENPTRSEIVLEKVATDLDELNIERIESALKEDRQALHRMANQFSSLVTKATPVLDRTLPFENDLSLVAVDLRKTLRKLNNFCDDPKLSPDLKDTINTLQVTVKTAQSAIHELNVTLTDKSFQSNLSLFKESTTHLENSVDTLHQISDNEQLRTDMKQIMQDTRKAVEMLDEIFQKPTSNSNVKETLSKVISTLADVDLVARQLSQILGQKHPLMHMLLGRPGYIKTEETQVEVHDEIK